MVYKFVHMVCDILVHASPDHILTMFNINCTFGSCELARIITKVLPNSPQLVYICLIQLHCNSSCIRISKYRDRSMILLLGPFS